MASLLANSDPHHRREDQPWLLAPCDLQALKAAGVTFVASMLERVIEEQARGDASKAAAVRAAVVAIMGDNLSLVKPGSEQAAQLKQALLAQGAWSQYLEVGIGPDAEIFTKCPAMASVGTGSKIGVHPVSVWSNPEPEAVMVVPSMSREKPESLASRSVPTDRPASRAAAHAAAAREPISRIVNARGKFPTSPSARSRSTRTWTRSSTRSSMR